ncbi:MULTISPECIES: c-type cytochrome [unclassified Flavobacterium]|uniref:c-type cytochrome n=1 Tax=unclassified Flavobacterium TaxID=196869 RepID=UPI00360DE2CA
MKKLLFTLLVFSFLSCKKESQEQFGKTDEDLTTTTKVQPEALGQEIFEGKGVCYTCHKPEVKTVGPSIQDIAKIYKEKGGSITEFLKEKSEPIVDPSQYATMKTNFAITKNLPEEELKALEAYMLSFAK